MEKDRLERDMLDKRIKEKDQQDKGKPQRTGNMIENPKTSKLEMDENEKIALTGQIRKLSRYSFLKNRVEQQIDLWKRKLDEEKKLFGDVILTEEEIKYNDINQKIYDLALARLKPAEDVQKYRMPDGYEDEKGHTDFDKKYSVLFKKFKDEKKDKDETEEEAWEKTQKNRTMQTKLGAQNVKKPSDAYSMLIDNQIDFVQKDVLKGYKDKKIREMKENNVITDSKGQTMTSEQIDEIAEINAEELKLKEIADNRKTLPIYDFKDDLLSAIRDYQVLIIVGETGSGKTTQIPQYLHEIGYTKFGKIGISKLLLFNLYVYFLLLYYLFIF